MCATVSLLTWPHCQHPALNNTLITAPTCNIGGANQKDRMLKRERQRSDVITVVARERRFTKDTAHLGVSKPALNHSVQSLGKYLELRLPIKTMHSVPRLPCFSMRYAIKMNDQREHHSTNIQHSVKKR